MAQLISVKLSRFDASPWGFRLQGGKDFGAPLLIQKVNGGSLAEKAGLLAGDAVIRVNNVEVFNLRHKEAQDVIVKAGNNFEVAVQRGGSTWKPSVTPVGPTPTINTSSPAANIQPVTKTSLAAHKPESKPIGTGHNLAAKPFAAPQINGEPTVKSIVNKQYNTPVGMYSEESIAETLSAQAEVLAGGVLGVNFMKNEKNYNAANSEVFKMVQEIDKEPRDLEPEPAVASTPVISPPVSGLRHVSAPETRPTPTTPHEDPFKVLPLGQNICAECERLIVGVFVRIKDKNLHVECFKCATCGTSLKNVGYYNINNKLYCDVHAKLVARQHPPAPNLEPITIPPGGKAPAGTISAALSSAAAPAARPVPGPTSTPAVRPAPAPAPLSPSSPQTIGPMPFHAPRVGTSHVSAPRPVQTPMNLSAPKPFSVPTASTTSPARPAPATSNKFVWPPPKEEEVHSSLLATATPLYIPTTPSQQPNDISVTAVSASTKQNQSAFLDESQHVSNQIEQVVPKQIPSSTPVQTEEIASIILSSSGSSQETSHNKNLSLETQERLDTMATISSDSSISQPVVQENISQEQIVESKEEEKVICTKEPQLATKSTEPEEHAKKIFVCSQEVSSITKFKTSELAIENVQVQTSDIKEIQRPLSPPPSNEETVSSEQASSLNSVQGEITSPSTQALTIAETVSSHLEPTGEEIVCAQTQSPPAPTEEPFHPVPNKQDISIQKSPQPAPIKKEIDSNQNPPISVPTKEKKEASPELSQPVPTKEEKEASQSVPTKEEIKPSQKISQPVLIKGETITSQMASKEIMPSTQLITGSESIQSTSYKQEEIQVSSDYPQTYIATVSQVTKQTATPEIKQIQSITETSNPHNSILQPIQSPSNNSIKYSAGELTTAVNKGLSYKQIPVPSGGDFRPICLDQQTEECQEVSQIISQESFHKITNVNKSIANPAPILFQSSLPRLNKNPTIQSPINNPGKNPNDQLPDRSETCQSPMVSALTIAPDRPYCLIPSAIKPQPQPTPQAPIYEQSTMPKCSIPFTAMSPKIINMKPKITAAQESTQSSHKGIVPCSPLLRPLPTSDSKILKKNVTSNVKTLEDETQLPLTPALSNRISMIEALTIAPDRPYSPFAPTTVPLNTVVQSEASAFTAVSPQTINTKPKITTVQQSTPSSHKGIVPHSPLLQPLPTSDSKRAALMSSSPRPPSRTSLPVMGAFRPTVPTGDLKPQTPDTMLQVDFQQFETGSSSIEKGGLPTTTQMIITDKTGGQVVVQRTRRVEESSIVSHKEIQKTIQRSCGQKPVVSSSSQQFYQEANVSTIEKKDVIGSQQQMYRQQQKSLSSRSQSQHIPTQKAPVPSQQVPQPQIHQSKTVHKNTFDFQKEQQQKQLYSLSGIQKPGVVPFYQQDIERYQRQRALSPAPHSQQIQRALSPVLERKSPNIEPFPQEPQQQLVSQLSTLSPAPKQQSMSQMFSATLPSSRKQQPQSPSKSATLPRQNISEPASMIPSQKTESLSTSQFSLPFPNIPLPEGISVESLMKDIKLSTSTAQPKSSQVVPSVVHAFKQLSTAQPLQTLPSSVTQSSTNAFKPFSPQMLITGPQQETPNVATQPSSVTKIPVPPSSSSIPNAGGGIGGGVGGGPTGQKGSASFAGSSAPRRGRGVLTQQTPGARIPLCGHCNSQIRGPFITALGRIWCPEHFVCVNGQCRRPLQDIGFVEEKGELYCEFCFEQFIAPTCNKCSKKIKGDCLNAISKHFHPECFLCAYCGKLFGNNPFYLEDGLPYCETDWNELFTTKCFACGFPIEAGDRWVEALNNNYHSQCFNCTSCKKNLEGQNFYAKGGRPFCKAHAR